MLLDLAPGIPWRMWPYSRSALQLRLSLALHVVNGSVMWTPLQGAYVRHYSVFEIGHMIALFYVYFIPVGQFWHRNFTRERFTGSAALPDNAYQVTTPTELGSGSFISVFYHLTWDLRDEGCLYAGTRQAGATRYVSSPADSVIEGEYTNYKVLHHFGTEYEFSVFSYEDYGCPAFPGIPIRSSE